MDDISALLGALQATQARKSAARLSERNVVELVLKLKQLGLLGDELLHTINGKEYITTHRLRADVEAALRAAGGRLELAELPALVGVDLVHCEKQVRLPVGCSAHDAVVACSNSNNAAAIVAAVRVQCALLLRCCAATRTHHFFVCKQTVPPLLSLTHDLYPLHM
jgi:E3 UFM1-protein ligase 1